MTAFTDKEMLTDVLSTQKFVTSGYNTAANEAKSEGVKNAFLTILNEEHRIQHDVFTEMNAHGWYPTENAPQNKIDQAKQQFSCDVQG